jgi:hypothetical protein
MEDVDSKCLFYLVGLYDRTLQHHSSGFAEIAAPMTKMSSVLRNLDNMLKELCCSPKGEQRMGRDVVDFETELIIPVPKLYDNLDLSDKPGSPLFCENLGGDHFAPLLGTLPDLIQRLCYSSDPATKSNTQQLGPLDIKVLVDCLRKLGVPVPLRRTIEYLYRNFAIVSGDPFSFDVLLDLYDTFATLHAGLTGDPPKHLGRCESSDLDDKGRDQGRILMDERKVRNLASLAEALHNAMAHRTLNAFRTAEWRDMAVDFRGGLNQILLATDAPLKCGLGVLRRFTAREAPPHSKRGTLKDTVGCFIRVGMTPGIRCHPIILGFERRARLAFFDADVPHILHVASYADYLHEAFHLVFQAVLDRGDRFGEVIKSHERSEQEFLDEVFALSLWKLCVFGSDKEAFAYHYILSFSRDMASVGRNNADTWGRLVNVLIQVFFATECWEARIGDPRFWKGTRKVTLREAERRFVEFAERVGPFFSEFERLWQADPRALALSEFRRAYVLVMDDLPMIWGEVLRIYCRTMEETCAGDEASVRKMTREIARSVIKGFNEGRPLLWSGYKPPASVNAAQQSVKGGQGVEQNIDGGLDALQFVCRILHLYIRTIRKACPHRGGMKQIHLLRDSVRANLDYSVRTNWWEYQSDKGAAALFCCVPKFRQRRLRKQIVVIKSFWDLASELRARRLLEMLNAAGL